MNVSFRFALTLLSTVLLLPTLIGCQSSTPRATSYQMNYQPPDQSQFQPQALPDVDANLFYKELKPYGNWINHQTYGRVWYPSGVPKNWRPYSNGHWARTQEYGWLWVANEPWGWAPFHYGRWARDDGYGWIWIPGHTWAPAWVFWRSGGGYSAWAPMPPNAVWRPNVGLNTQHFDYDRDIYSDAWTGSCNSHLAYRDMSKHRPDISMSSIIRRTDIVQNNVAIVNNTIVNPGPVINVIDAPIVPVTVTTTVPVNVITTSASTATAVVVQPQIQAPTLEQVAKEEQLAKALAEQNAAAALVNKKEPKEPERLTGIPAPEGIATPIKNQVTPSEAPVTPTPYQGQAVDSTIPTTPTPLPVTHPISTPQNPAPLPASTFTPASQDPAPLPASTFTPAPQDSAPLPTSTFTPASQDSAPLPASTFTPAPQDSAPLPASTFTPASQNPAPLPASTFTPTLPEPTPAPAPMPALPEPTPVPAPMPALPEPTPVPAPMPALPEPTPAPAPMPALPEPTPAPAPMPALPEPTPAPVVAPAPTAPADAAKKKADCLATGRTDCDNP
ncbi:MAG: hypothetical protein NTW85_06175 [Methylococcales bacterium]|nr:hypothetical protein [Methylococcales bacterium]